MAHTRLTRAQLLKQAQRNRIKLADGRIIHKVNNFVFDVFADEGWENHSRYQRVKGNWVHISGTKLTADSLKQVVQAL